MGISQVKPYDRWPSGDSRPLAVLGHSPDDLSQRYGLRFEESFDDLDYYRLAAIKLPKIGQVWLMHYEGEPAGEMTVYADARADFGGVLSALITVLELSSRDLSWVSPDAKDWEAHQVVAPLAAELRRHLGAFLAGEESLTDFRAWLAPVLWMIEECGEPDAEALAYDIELAFAEQASGAWDAARLRVELQHLAGHGSHGAGDNGRA